MPKEAESFEMECPVTGCNSKVKVKLTDNGGSWQCGGCDNNIRVEVHTAICLVVAEESVMRIPVNKKEG